MNQLVTAGGQRIELGTSILREEGYHDDFNRGDQDIDSPWVDAAIQYPTMYDTVDIEDNQAAFMPTHSNGDTLDLGHHLIYRDIGVSTDFEVGIAWMVDDDERLIGQVSPAVLIDPNGGGGVTGVAAAMELGLSATYDISIINGACYIQNIFRKTPISDVFYSGRSVTDMTTNGSDVIVSNTAAFTTNDIGRAVNGTNIPSGALIDGYIAAAAVTLDVTTTGSGTNGTLNIPGPYTGLNVVGNQGPRINSSGATTGTNRGPKNWLAIRVTGGTMQQIFNGTLLGSPVSIPAWAVGRTLAGIHVISAKVSVGETGVGGGTITTIIPDVADNWYWRPL